VSFTGAELEALIPRLRRYAHALARHPVRPDDLVQDTLERAWSRRRQWQPGTDLRAWLFTILHNTFISELRRFTVRGYDAETIDGTDRGASTLAGGEMVNSQVGVMRDIERALAALPVEQRAVVLLVGLEDLSYREAAEVLGIPVGTVMSRLSRGRARLRELMDGGPVARRDGPGPSGGDSAAPLKVVR
jgi:RNA polymerase sigma-70 factor, ECF subfamily